LFSSFFLCKSNYFSCLCCSLCCFFFVHKPMYSYSSPIFVCSSSSCDIFAYSLSFHVIQHLLALFMCVHRFLELLMSPCHLFVCSMFARRCLKYSLKLLFLLFVVLVYLLHFYVQYFSFLTCVSSQKKRRSIVDVGSFFFSFSFVFLFVCTLSA
jgi:hypothetical protein